MNEIRDLVSIMSFIYSLHSNVPIFNLIDQEEIDLKFDLLERLVQTVM